MPDNGRHDPAAERPPPTAGGAPPRASWQAIYDALHDAVVRHQLVPGAKIVEEEVAELFGVSRTIVRAALQALGRDGILVIERNKGARIARPSPAEARGIFEARELIEPKLAALAAGRMEAGDAARLEAALEAEHRALAADRPRDALFLSADFHRVIADLSGHAVLAAILKDLLSRSSLVIALYWRGSDGSCRNHAHHALVEALAARDAGRAGLLMRQHLAQLTEELDLSERPVRPSSIAAALSRAPGS